MHYVGGINDSFQGFDALGQYTHKVVGVQQQLARSTEMHNMTTTPLKELLYHHLITVVGGVVDKKTLDTRRVHEWEKINVNVQIGDGGVGVHGEWIGLVVSGFEGARGDEAKDLDCLGRFQEAESCHIVDAGVQVRELPKWDGTGGAGIWEKSGASKIRSVEVNGTAVHGPRLSWAKDREIFEVGKGREI
ncbi:hypothetical protein CPB85DRAFT_376097 [Mucidula mucida]|nr:hypothetical protein CPB85DRAFT_376097 [Mucidula mucida]